MKKMFGNIWKKMEKDKVGVQSPPGERNAYLKTEESGSKSFSLSPLEERKYKENFTKNHELLLKPQKEISNKICKIHNYHPSSKIFFTEEKSNMYKI